MDQKKKIGPTQPSRHDDLGDTFPNDWLEALIIFLALVGIGGGAVSLYYLSTLS
jgi:hypothetical protein